VVDGKAQTSDTYMAAVASFMAQRGNAYSGIWGLL